MMIQTSVTVVLVVFSSAWSYGYCTDERLLVQDGDAHQPGEEGTKNSMRWAWTS